MGAHIKVDPGKHTVKDPEIMKKIIQKLLWIIGFKPQSVYRVSLGKSIPGSSNMEVVKVVSSQRTSVTVNILPGDNGSGCTTIFPVPRNDSYEKDDLPALFFLALNFAAAFFCSHYDYRGDKLKIKKTNSDSYFRKNFISLFFQREKKEAEEYRRNYQSLLVRLNDFFEQLEKAGLEVQKEVRERICQAYLLPETSEQSSVSKESSPSEPSVSGKEPFEQAKNEEDSGVALLNQYYEAEEKLGELNKEIEALQKAQKNEDSLAEKKEKIAELTTDIDNLGKKIDELRKEQEKKEKKKMSLEKEVEPLEKECQQNLKRLEELKAQKEVSEKHLEDLKKEIEENDRKAAEERKKDKLRTAAMNIKKVLEEAGITAEDMANLAELMKSGK